MEAALRCCLLVLCVTRIYSVTLLTSAGQRKAAGESCKFRWNVTGNVTAYSIKLLSSTTALGPNTNHTFNSSNGLITLVIWNIQTSNAGYYSLSISTGSSTDEKSIVWLFVYGAIYIYPILAVGRNPGFEGDRIELNCSATLTSLPAAESPNIYYFWRSSGYGDIRNISSGPAVLSNGDLLPRYSVKNDGKTLSFIASSQYADGGFYCSAQEENSPYKSSLRSLSLTIYRRPFAYSYTPASRKFNAVLNSYVNLYFYFQAIPPLTSYSNWSFVSATGSTGEYPVGTNLVTNYVPLSFTLSSVNSYGNYSVTLTNSNGSTTETFQVLPLGPPDTPSNFIAQYTSNSRISLQWRCMWFNGAQQTVSVRLTDIDTNIEVERKDIPVGTTCFDSRYGTLFQTNIQPERNYEASIWSTNSFGTSSVVGFALRTPKRLILSVSSANISIVETDATINFLISDSTTTVIRLNVTCCVEITAECSNKSYILTKTDTRVIYDILPPGSEFVFDFNVFDTDGYTYEYNLALVKGVRVSATSTANDPTTCIPIDTTTIRCACNGTITLDEGNPSFVPVIVLAVLLGIAVLVLIGCCIGLLLHKHRQKNSSQPQKKAQNSVAARNASDMRESFADDNYETMIDMDRSKNDTYYKALGGTPGNAKQFSDARYVEHAPESRKEDDLEPNPYMNRDEIFYTNSGGTLYRPEINRYQ